MNGSGIEDVISPTASRIFSGKEHIYGLSRIINKIELPTCFGNGTLHRHDEKRRQNENLDERRDMLTRYAGGGGYSI